MDARKSSSTVFYEEIFFSKSVVYEQGLHVHPKSFFDLQKKDSDNVSEFVRADNEQPTAAENW